MTAPAVEQPVEVTGPEQGGELPVRFPVVVIEGMPTSDGRLLLPGSLSPRALPLSLLACPASAHGGNEPDAATVIGRIDTLTRHPGPDVVSATTGQPFPPDTFVWSGTGVIDADHPIADLVRRRYLRGVSVDLTGMDVEIVDDGDGGPGQMIAHKASIGAVTLVPLPAFGDAYVEVVGEPAVPEPEQLDGPTGLVAAAWVSSEVGDPVRIPDGALTAAGDIGSGDKPWPAAIPPRAEAADQLAQVIDDDTSGQRDAAELAAAIVDYIAAQWATGDTDTPADDEQPDTPDDAASMAAAPPPPAPDDTNAPDDTTGPPPETGIPDAPQPCPYGPAEHPATMSLLFTDPDPLGDGALMYVPVCPEHEQQARDELANEGGEVQQVVDIPADGASDDELPEEAS